MPSFVILETRVLRFMPKRTAAPRGPATTQLVADTAGQGYAYREVATTLQHALALVPHLPEAPARTQHALTM